jgi:hypothetical protein
MNDSFTIQEGITSLLISEQCMKITSKTPRKCFEAYRAFVCESQPAIRNNFIKVCNEVVLQHASILPIAYLIHAERKHEDYDEEYLQTHYKLTEKQIELAKGLLLICELLHTCEKKYKNLSITLSKLLIEVKKQGVTFSPSENFMVENAEETLRYYNII